VIRDRYAAGSVEQLADEHAPTADTPVPDQPADQPAPAGTPTYDELNALTIDELEDRIRTWNAEHPDGPHLIISGRKGELVGRLLDAYETAAAPTEPAAPVEPADTPAPADQTVPAAPVPTATDGTPADPAPAAAPDAAGAGTTTPGGTAP
jgi:hypothetical protein